MQLGNFDIMATCTWVVKYIALALGHSGNVHVCSLCYLYPQIFEKSFSHALHSFFVWRFSFWVLSQECNSCPVDVLVNCAGVTTTAVLEEIPHNKVEVSLLSAVALCLWMYGCDLPCSCVEYKVLHPIWQFKVKMVHKCTPIYAYGK